MAKRKPKHTPPPEPLPSISMFDRMVWEAETNPDPDFQVGGKLARLGGEVVLHPRDLPKWPDLLAREGLVPEQCTEKAILIAAGIDRRASANVDIWCREWNRKLMPDLPTPTPTGTSSGPVAKPSSSSKRSKLFNYPVTAVIRWMGVEGWSRQRAEQVLKTLGLNVAPATVYAQLRAGQTGERGEPAGLTDGEVDALYDAVED